MVKDGTEQLTRTQGQALCRLARQTIMEIFGKSLPEDEIRAITKELDDEKINQIRGVFVTLTIQGRLRGCIGNLSGYYPMRKGVMKNAVNAALHDTRFPPLTVDELALLNISVSILSQPQPFPYVNGDDLMRRLKRGVDGVILKQGVYSATFLPQVWEQLPEPVDFLSHLAAKAGLSPESWKNGNVEVSTYQVQYFEEGK